MPRIKRALALSVPASAVVPMLVGAANAPATHATHVTPPAPDPATAPDLMMQGLAAVKIAAHHYPPAQVYTVRAGDTLSRIAKRELGHVKFWPALWKANEKTIHNPNLLMPGQKITLPQGSAVTVSARLTAEAFAAMPKAPKVHHHHATAHTAAAHASSSPARGDRWDGKHGACGDGDGDGFDMPCSALHHNAPMTVHRPGQGVTHDAGNVSAIVNPSGYGSFQACVISRESGGNSQITNSTGHYGLYQFSYSTWVANGGNPSSFGRASVAEQNQVFANTYAASGTSAWSPYDGC